MVSIVLVLFASVFGGNSIYNFILAFRKGEVRRGMDWLLERRKAFMISSLALVVISISVPIIIDNMKLDDRIENPGLPVLEYPQYDLSLVYVEGGSFEMGSSSGESDESPVHRVVLDRFVISKYEITNKQYCAFLNEKGNQSEGGVEWINLAGSFGDTCRISKKSGLYTVGTGYEDHAVIYVSWYGARAYCVWLSSKMGKEVRLPTETEWEYAARGGKKSRGYTYSGSNTIGEVAWYYGNSSKKVHKVGGKSPNELGLYDMSGNVYEWCLDWYGGDYYSSSPSSNPKGPSSGKNKVARGGSWWLNASECRVAHREANIPVNRRFDRGFRVAFSQ